MKTNLLLLIFFLVFTLASSAQITLTKNDTVSDALGVHVYLEWIDANPLATEWTLRLGGSGVQNQTTNIAPTVTVNKRSVELNSYNSRIYGWGCFFNQYIKTAWLDIVGNTGSYFGQNIPVPSNYIQIGCKPMDAGIGLFPKTTGLDIAWDYYTISGSYTLTYSYNGGTVTTVKPCCSAYTIPYVDGAKVDLTVSTTCPDGSITSKSSSYTFPVTTTTPVTSPTTKPGGKPKRK